MRLRRSRWALGLRGFIHLVVACRLLRGSRIDLRRFAPRVLVVRRRARPARDPVARVRRVRRPHQLHRCGPTGLPWSIAGPRVLARSPRPAGLRRRRHRPIVTVRGGVTAAHRVLPDRRRPLIP